MEALKNAIATLVVAVVASLATWAYNTNEKVTKHESSMRVILNESGGSRPSIEAVLNAQAINYHLHMHETGYYNDE